MTQRKGLKRAFDLEKFFGTEMMLASPALRQAGGGSRSELTMERVREIVDECTKCSLHEGRTHIVFGEGNPSARLVFVGEGPGRDEDRQGRPFVGRAGQMLTRIIENVLYMEREDVYIANIVKCRPPQNRTPLPDEAGACMPYLALQLEVLQPEIIVALGTTAAHNLLGEKTPIGRMRGRFHDHGGVKVMPTYHPAYLLRNPAEKRKVFEDMLMVRDELGIEPPEEAG